MSRRDRDAYSTVGAAERASIVRAIEFGSIDRTGRALLAVLHETASYSKVHDLVRIERLAEIANLPDLKELGRILGRLEKAGAIAIPDYTRRVRSGKAIWLGLSGQEPARQSPLISVVNLPPSEASVADRPPVGGRSATDRIEKDFREENPREELSRTQLSEEVQTAATAQSTAALSLHDQAIEAVTAAEADPIGRAIEHLRNASDFQDERTRLAIRSVVAKWALDADDLFEALNSLEEKRLGGAPIFQGECAYFVGTLNQIGQKREAA